MSRAGQSPASRIYCITRPGAKGSCAGLICRRVIDDCERIRPQEDMQGQTASILKRSPDAGAPYASDRRL
ncbi:hypothetical protein DPX16_3621 [Anabarilius grahami]|uniref:Uncharacterized protein n=1 Tax=Anabarilius grahami TaxID=495550 RepID=A0A3N0XR70_ANAGA|nr:hypothetical protein DPX16_3621 [Anabarilius grahami]